MCSLCDVGTLEVRGEASGHKALQTSMKVEQVLATRSGADGCAEVLVKWEVPPWRNPNPNPDP